MGSRESWPQTPIIEDLHSAFRDEIFQLQEFLHKAEKALKINREGQEQARKKLEQLEESPKNKTMRNELLEAVVAFQKRIKELKKIREDIMERISLLAEEEQFHTKALLEHEGGLEN